MRFFFLMFLVLVLVFGITNPSTPQIYKYKDEKGQWYFSDKPPPGKEAAAVAKEVPKKNAASSNLKAKLYDKFEPKTNIQAATLAVVSIDTPIFYGSGFFISEDGHLITAKHIIKLSDSPMWKEFRDKLNNKDKEIKEAKKKLEKTSEELAFEEDYLKRYKKAINKAKNSYANPHFS